MLTFYSITSSRGPHAHLPVTYFQFHKITFHLVLVEFLTSSHSALCSLQPQTLSSVRCRLKTHYFQSVYPALLHPSLMCCDSLLRFWHNINYILTCLHWNLTHMAKYRVYCHIYWKKTFKKYTTTNITAIFCTVPFEISYAEQCLMMF